MKYCHNIFSSSVSFVLLFYTHFTVYPVKIKRTLLIILSYPNPYINVQIIKPNFFLKNLKIFVFSIAIFKIYGMIESQVKETK